MKAGLKRFLDAHVEPALDRARDKLHRNAINQCARQNGDETEHQHQPQLESGTENLSLIIAPQRTQLPADQPEHADGEHDVQADQQWVVARENNRVRRRRHEQQKPEDAAYGRCKRPTGNDKALHLLSTGKAGKVTGHVFQSEDRLQSLLPSEVI